MNFKKLAANASKLLIAAATIIYSVPAFAEGYQVNSQSARQLGMGHTGTALKLGAESMLFNPAGMAYMDSKLDFSFGLTAIKSKVTLNNSLFSAETKNPLSTPLFGYIGYKPGKNLAFGVSITNPAGNSLKWPENWAGSTFVQDISLKAFSVQPTVSYKIGDFISFGAGLMINFGSFNMNKGLIAANSFDGLGTLASGLSAMMPALAPLPGMIQSFKDQIPASMGLEGKSKVSFGYNLGVMVNVSKKITLGASYRSQVKLSVEGGEAKVSYANDNAAAVINAIKTFDTTPLKGLEAAGHIPAGTVATLTATQAKLGLIGVLDGANFDASLPIPYVLSFGAAYKPTEKWTVTGDFQLTGWSAYKSLVITFDETTNNYALESIKNYNNSWAIRFGTQWDATKFATLRLGFYVDTTPVQLNNYSPETPGATSGCVTLGATLRPAKFMAIDLAFAYLQGAKTTGAITEGADVFGGDYQKSAFMPSIGLRFNL